MAKHIPNTSWSLRSPEYGAYVRTFDEESLYVVVVGPDGLRQHDFLISRKDARLLARRLNACLDATTEKAS